MNQDSKLTPEVREDLIRRAWYIHDAAWFAAVRTDFGIEAANRLNHRAVHTVGLAEARRLARALGTPAASDLERVIELVAAGRDVYVAPPLIEMETTQLDDRSYELRVTTCFVAEHIAKAGMAAEYECAVFDRVDAWHEGLGIPLAEGQLEPAPCAVANGGECRRVLHIQPALS